MLAAVGTTDAAFDADQVDVTINGVTVCRGGADRRRPREGVDLHRPGRSRSTIDLQAGAEHGDRSGPTTSSIAYVHENSAYST